MLLNCPSDVIFAVFEPLFVYLNLIVMVSPSPRVTEVNSTLTPSHSVSAFCVAASDFMAVVSDFVGLFSALGELDSCARTFAITSAIAAGRSKLKGSVIFKERIIVFIIFLRVKICDL